jgi:hypothetical protein
MGWIIHGHGELYAREYGWDAQFEALVAEIFTDRRDLAQVAWLTRLGRFAGQSTYLNQTTGSWIAWSLDIS